MHVKIAYLVSAQNLTEAKKTCHKVRYEQSVELPDNTLSSYIRENYVGHLEDIQEIGNETYYAEISYNKELLGDDFSQLLNVLFGNVSLFDNVTICGIDWKSLPITERLGPRFGIPGIRALLQVPDRALTCTAIKPVGFTSSKLAELVYQFSVGGIDIIKDDHGLSNQSFSTFTSRVDACMNAVNQSEDETGKRSLYFPNITADGSETIKRFEYAIEKNCGGVLVCPQLCGLGSVNQLRNLNQTLPIMAHPAFSGAYVREPVPAFTKAFYYGELWRAMGADFVIYPNYGGRFSFRLEECLEINTALRKDSLPFKKSFATPGGGLQRNTIPRFLHDYGNDTVFLIGGSLYQHPKGIKYGAKEFLEMVSDS